MRLREINSKGGFQGAFLVGISLTFGTAGCLGDTKTEVDAEVETITSLPVETAVCSAADVTWSSPGSSSLPCTGPWTYMQYPTETSRHELCDVDRCQLRAVCNAWVAQTPSVTTENIAVDGINCVREQGRTRCDPDTETAEERCGDFLADEVDRIEGLGRVTGSSVTTVRLSPRDQMVHTFQCTATINWDKWLSGRHESCACETLLYKSCLHVIRSNPPVPADRTVRVVTPTGRTKTQVRNAHVGHPTVRGQLTGAEITPICSSGEDQAALEPKLRRLLDGLADPQIAPNGSELRDELTRRAKITYELFSNLDVAVLPAARHAAMLDLYLLRPTVEPACGRNKPSTTATCHGDWALRLCTRLTSTHVAVTPTSGDLVSRLYRECLGQLHALGDGIGDGTCAAESDYATRTLDVHRSLQEKLLLRFGLAFNPKQPAVASLAGILHLIDHWYVEAARVLTDAPALRTELALFLNKFWQVAHGFQPGTANGWLPGNLYAELIAELGDTTPELDALFQTTEANAFALDRAILTAAYGLVGSEPVMVGRPLLEITNEALDPLVERLDGLVQFHDVGCSLVNCAAFSTPTKLSRFWKVLAHLTAGPGSVPDLGAVLTGTAGDLLGWKPVFQAMQGAQQRLLDAAAAAAQSGLPEDMALQRMVDEARNRIASYESTGLFLPAVGNRLNTGVHAAQRANVAAHLVSLRNGIEGRLDNIESRFNSLVSGLVQVQQGQTALAQAEATEDRLRRELDDLAVRAEAFRAVKWPRGEDVSSTADSVFEELMAAWAQIQGSVDEATYLQVGSTERFRPSGQSVQFDTWENTTVPDLGLHMVQANPGETISVSFEANHAWSPSCALRGVRLIDPEVAKRDPGAEGYRIDPVNVPTGPEGYSITWTGSGFSADSANRGSEKRTTVGVRAEACASSPGSASGSGVRACGYVDHSETDIDGEQWVHGNEGRTTVQFASGIYVPTTPFEAPAGSLLVVEMPRGGTEKEQIRRLHLVRAPHTTIVVSEPSDLYFVVNDRFCPEQDDAQLDVAVRKLTGVGNAAIALLRRMAHAMSVIDDRIPDILKRGELLEFEATDIEMEAKFGTVSGPGVPQIPVDQYPQPIKDLFHKFLAREMNRLSATVRLVNLEREIANKEGEYRAIQITRDNARMSGYLLSLLPKWSVRGMYLKELRDESAVFARDVRYYLAPMMKIWHPGVLAAIQADSDLVPEVQLLADVDADTSPLVMASWLMELGRKVAGQIEEAEFPYPSPQDTAPTFVALRFPKPSELDPACADSPSARCRRQGLSIGFRWATVAQSRALWDALGQPSDGQTMRRLVFRLGPDDIYQPTAGTHYLPCSKSLPIVRKMGLFFTGYGDTENPVEQRQLEGRVPEGAPMLFSDGFGVHEFQLENPTWHNLAAVPAIFGGNDYNQMKGRFDSIPQDVRGVSPFTEFVLEIPENLMDDWLVRDAKTVDLVLELEAIRSAANVSVPACTTTP